MKLLKINLGSGDKKIKDFLNLDKYSTFSPDYVHDLEKFPYPFIDNEVSNIMLSHVLEHIGQNPNTFNDIMKELYRICCNNALIEIVVPHPRHDNFLSDPTHVRPITLLGLQLYDLNLNKKWIAEKAANSPLAIIHNVNFEITETFYYLEKEYDVLLKEKKITKEELDFHVKHYNNVITQIKFILKVIKT